MYLNMSAMSVKNVQPLASRFRRFNRFYTALLGILSRGYLNTPLSLQEARVVFEVASNPGYTAKDIQSRASFDQGYLSRLIARLTRAGLLRKTQSVEDRRAQKLVLTSTGKRTFTILDRAADAQARRLFSKLSYEQALTLSNALRTIQLLLDPDFPTEPSSIREQRVGDLGWAFYRQAAVYKREFHYNDAFEAHVCRGLSPFLETYEPKKDHLWVGELGGQPVGFIAVQHVANRPGWAQLRWFFVERKARGHGLGSRLLEKAIAFCKKFGYKGIFLWTVSDLDSARQLYKKFGFRLTREEKEACSWAPWAREQCWELNYQSESA